MTTRIYTSTLLLALFSFSVAQGAEEISVELCVDEPRESTPEDPITLGYSRSKAHAWAFVEYTVTKEGKVQEVTVIDKGPEILPTGHVVENAKSFSYDPRVVDGEAVEVLGVQHIIRYLARLVDGSGDQPAAADAYRCFRVPDDPYWRSVIED